jgi:hypothetical protein
MFYFLSALLLIWCRSAIAALPFSLFSSSPERPEGPCTDDVATRLNLPGVVDLLWFGLLLTDVRFGLGYFYIKRRSEALVSNRRIVGKMCDRSSILTVSPSLTSRATARIDLLRCISIPFILESGPCTRFLFSLHTSPFDG